MMTDEQLIAFVTEFRTGLLDGAESDEMCFAVCWPLSGLLRVHGIDVELVESRSAGIGCNHYWLRMPDGRVLDPTADQFNYTDGFDFPPVYLGVPTELHGVA